jgi:AcrR family transcriptional regulator
MTSPLGGGACISAAHDVSAVHMRFSSDDSAARRDSYHHGNLREALIEGALRLIGERGPAGFSFAELARAAGVSPAAPYRHFRDRNALVAEIARQGYERFADELERAWADGRPDPVSAIENCGKAYLAFARRDPASYAAMFETGFPLEEDAMLLRASEHAFGVLRRAAEFACNNHRTGGIRPPPMMVALHIWAMAHGIAALFIGRGDGARRKLPMTAEELLESGLLVYLQSLGLASHPA